MSGSIKSKFDLTGKVAIVTGSSKGIGASMAMGLAEFGAQVVISSRKQDAVDELASQFKQQGLEVTALACHVGKEEQRKALVDEVLTKLGRIDILINNAAINPYYGPITNMDVGAYRKTQEVNVEACLSMSNLVHSSMKENGGGSIIHISSIESFHPGQGMSAYSISKAALNMLTQAQAKEWGRFGIRVNAIAPGLIKTKFSQALWQNEALMQHIKQNVPAGRAADPDEMAGLAVFLASDAASYCTGGVYVADGGFMLSGGL